jgi:hypothetical protein
LALCSRYPGEQRPTLGADRLRWTVRLRPTPLSVTYTVLIDYRSGHCPRVVVIDPPLEIPDGKTLPHVFPGDELCLFYGTEFDGRKDLIADTIVPWISEWLYFYELWLTTGEWHGGGVHPDSSSRSRRR